MNNGRILLYPYMTEKIVRMSGNNIIAFIVSDDATRTDVKNSVEKLYGFKVKKVNIEKPRRGKKKAYIFLVGEGAAMDFAGKLGLM